MEVASTWGSRLLEQMRHRGDGMWRVTWRLAAQTVALLLIMLLILEVVVYVITQQSLLSSLEGTLKARSNVPPDFISATYNVPPQSTGGVSSLPGGQRQGQDGDVPHGGPGGPHGPNPDQAPSDVNSVFFDREMHIVHHDGGLGSVLLDLDDVEEAMRTNAADCCSVRRYRDQTYLVYTAPLSANGHVVGAVQNSISESQYQKTMETLLHALIAVALLGLLISSGISAVMVRRALDPIRAAVQRQREFVADAAHELRTPLAIMRTVGEVGLDAPSVDDLQVTVAQMLGQNQHLTRLVEDLSLLARTDTGVVAIERSQVDLSELVLATSTELGYLADEQGVTLHSDIQRGIRLAGDGGRLRQLLLILLDNALKYTPSGGTVQVQLSAHGSRAVLRVRDSGSGIDPAHLPHIFNRFYRADAARSSEGTGLGLAIAKWIVDAHGATIEARNAQGGGAVFTVTLPMGRVTGRAPVPESGTSVA
jgi:signal transduction histidine kinase